MEIKPIRIPRNLIRELPPPVVDNIPPPVVSGIEVPVIDVPTPVIDYPELDVPTQQQFEEEMAPIVPQVPQETQETEPEDNREMGDTPAAEVEAPPVTIELPVVGEVPLPPVAPLVTAGATAVVAASVTMGATILLNQVKTAVLDPMLKKMKVEGQRKGKKIKIKQKKPVLHFVQAENGVSVFEYSVKGTRLVDTVTDIEPYLRDQIEINSLYEFDNKIIVDDILSEKFTKEGQERFKKLFSPAKSIVKKLSAKISF